MSLSSEDSLDKGLRFIDGDFIWLLISWDNFIFVLADAIDRPAITVQIYE